MLLNFVEELRAAGIPASLKEHLVLLEALERDVIERTPEAFYYLSRATFVKDEGLLDRFDQVFQRVFKGVLSDYGQQPVEIPEDWLRKVAERYFSQEEMEQIKALGSWEEIMETLKKRLEEQENATRAAISGSARTALRRSAIRATIPKVSASAAKASTAARSRSGKSASSPISTTPANSAPATSRSRCAACAVSPAKARRRNSI
jgi:uncharacterized protein with von Willebrand factor type A (vWA) domain